MLNQQHARALKNFAKLITLATLSLFFSVAVSAKVITTIKPLAFIADAITDGVVGTEVLLPDGASPHTYSLKPSDIKRLRSADLIVWIGKDMEAFLTQTLRPIDKNKILELSVQPNIAKLIRAGHDDDEQDDGDEHGDQNLHIWLSPEIAKQIAISLCQKLVQLMPEKRVQLEANLNNFIEIVSKTEQKIENNTKNVQNKGYFVFHDAFSYFEMRFGFKHLGSFTINPEIQPGAQKLNRIKSQLLDNKAVCVFSEPQFRPAVIESIVKGTNVKIGTLDPLGMDIPLSKESYSQFLVELSDQFNRCLSDN